jgi:uridine kinase
MGAALAELKAGKPVDIPKYDFRTNSRFFTGFFYNNLIMPFPPIRLVDDHAHVDPVDVILVEGILVFFDPKMRDTFDLKLFVDADPDIRLARRGFP